MPLANAHLTQQARRTTVALVLVNLLVAGLLVAMGWHVLKESWNTYDAQAREKSVALASVAQLNIESELGRIDGVIRATAGEIERNLVRGGFSDKDFNEVLGERFALLPDAEAMRAADEHGLVRWGTALPPGSPTAVSDRDYFEKAVELQDGSTIVAGPLKSRVSGNWVLAFVRPLRQNGRFAGIVYVSMNVEHFRTMFQRLGLGPLDATTLRTNDLQLVARYSPQNATQGAVGDKAVSAELIANRSKDPAQGTYASRVAIDGKMRTTSYRALARWPFTVYAGVSNDEFMQPWRQQLWTVITLASLAWLLGAVASWSVYQANRRKDVAIAASRDESMKVRALLRIAADAVHILDRNGKLVEMSDSFAEMLRSSRDKLLGQPVWSWDATQDEAAVNRWLAKIKPGDRQKAEVQHRRSDGQILDVELHMSVTDIGGELLVFCSGRDVTDARKLSREQAAMLNGDLIGIAKISERTIIWHNRAAARIFGYEHGELDHMPARNLYLDQQSFEDLGNTAYPQLESTGRFRTQLRMRKKDGNAVWLDFNAAKLSGSEVFVMLVDITEIKDAQERLSFAAFHDALTKLPNRLLLVDRLDRALAVAKREKRGVAVGYLDVDGFKAVNDTYGHDAGDKLLQELARRLQDVVRPSDTVARIGGDEFVVVLTDLEGAEWKVVCERLGEAIKRPMAVGAGVTVTVGATIGVALAMEGDETGAHALIERADHAMLRGKRQGKDCVQEAEAKSSFDAA